MISIRQGKIFCERYNKENGSNLPPKEIFRSVVAPVLFGGEKTLFCLINSKLDPKNRKNKTFQNVLDEFCVSVESDTNLMTTLNVFGGCAEYMEENVKFKPQSSTTNYNTNIYYSIDERYYSFIGISFLFNMKGFSIAICNEDLIWDLWGGISRYRNAVDSGTFNVGNKLMAWNTAYITNKNKNDDFFVDSKGGVKTEFGNLYNFLSILLSYNVNFFEIENFGQQNITASTIFVEIEKLRRRCDIIKQCFVDGENEEFDYKGFSDCFGENLIFKSLECGALTKKMFDPKLEWFESVKNNKNNKNQFKNKYIEMITTKEIQENAITLNDVITHLKDKTKKDKVSKDVYFDNVYNATGHAKLLESIVKLKEICDDEYIEKLNNVFDFVFQMKGNKEDVCIFQCCVLRYRK